jgi:hypothetical protein
VETVKTLTEARDIASRNLEEMERQIAHARLNGDEAALKKLRKERDTALRDSGEANDAIYLAEKRECRERKEVEAGLQREQSGKIKALANERLAAADEVDDALANERLAAADEVDDALATLERKVERYRSLGRELGSMTGTGSAIARKESQNMRWAIWAEAEQTAELLCVPFANGRRRRTLAQLEDGK